MVRVSPAHPYKAGRAGLGWMSGWLQRNVYDACRGCVVVLALGDLVAWRHFVWAVTVEKTQKIYRVKEFAVCVL